MSTRTSIINIKLSVCIPTFNNGHVLAQTLDSVIAQGNKDIEIVVCDNASSDDTASIIAHYTKRFPHLRYFRSTQNIGFDRNILKAVAMARADYCWLLGDDALKSGAIARILREIKDGHDIYLVNKTSSDYFLNPVSEKTWFEHHINDRVFMLSSKRAVLEYLANARSIGALFSFISVDIFKREKWQSVYCDDAVMKTGYVHAYILLSLVSQGCTLKYIKDSLVLQRGGNDAFPLASNPVKRFLMDIDGYKLFADGLFADSDIRAAILRVITRENRWYRLAHVWHLEKDIREREKFETHLHRFGAFNRFVLLFAKIVGNAKFIVPFLLYLKKALKI